MTYKNYIIRNWPLLEKFFQTHAVNWDDFEIWPASNKRHHATRGGLAIHTIETIHLVDMFSIFPCYPMADMIIAAFCHDLGKLLEYAQDGSFVMAPNSHVALSVKLYVAMCDELNETPSEDVMDMIRAHHGRVEWGSLKNADTEIERIVHAADHGGCVLHAVHSLLESIGEKNEN